jgi:hypothetical protein
MIRTGQINIATANGVLAAQFSVRDHLRRRAIVLSSAVGAIKWDEKYPAQFVASHFELLTQQSILDRLGVWGRTEMIS